MRIDTLVNGGHMSLGSGFNGFAMTGPLILFRHPEQTMESTTKHYVDTNLATHTSNQDIHVNAAKNIFLNSITVTPLEINYLNAVTSDVQPQLDSKLNKSGGTMTGGLILSGNPTVNLQAATKQYVDSADVTKLPLAGGTLTGALTLSAAPTAGLHAATKQYVDDKDSDQKTYIDSVDANKLSLSGGTLTGALTLAAGPTIDLHPATKQYVDTVITTKLPLSGGTLTGALTLPSDPTANLHATTKQYVDTANLSKLNLSGGTLTGALILAAAPTIDLHASTKKYVDDKDATQKTYIDSADALKIAKAGDTMTGALVLSGAPTIDLHASTKKYVDDKDTAKTTYVDNQVALRVSKAGDTMTGLLTLSGAPTVNLHAATKQYVDDKDATQKTYIDSADATKLPLAGGTLTGLLTLSAAPTANLHAATKQYVDTADATKLPLTGGTLTGALTLSGAPSANLHAATKQYVDTADALKVSKAGDTLTGFLTLHADPTSNLHPATKQYVDNFEGSKPSTIIEKFNSVVPTGYLYCDGSYVSKTTYANLFAILGTTFDNVDQYCLIDYLKYSVIGEGKPWVNQFDINNFSATEVNNTVQSTGMLGALTKTQAIVTKNRIYLLGGSSTGNDAVATVYTAPINADGTIGTWSVGTSLPAALASSQVIVTKNRVYLLGGSSTGANAVATVYTAVINTDGTLGTWSAGTSLPGALAGSQAIVTKDRVYLLGGSSTGTNAVATVYTAPVNTDGTLGAWTTGTSIPSAASYASVTVIKNKVYLIGGYDGTVATNKVFKSTISADGTLGAWSTDAVIPGAKYAGIVVSSYGNIFYIGGYNNSTVYRAALSATGDITGWTSATNINHALGYGCGVFLRDKLFLLGNYLGTAVSLNTYYVAYTLSGINDYSLFYDGTLNTMPDGYIMGTKKFGTLGAPSATVFGLPNFVGSGAAGSYIYMKY